MQGIFFNSFYVPGNNEGKVQGITITEEAIKAGLLSKLKGPTLSLYLYLSTLIGCELDGSFLISRAVEALSCSRKDVLRAINELEQMEIISILDLDPTNVDKPISISLKGKEDAHQKEELEILLQQEVVTKEELVKGIVHLYQQSYSQREPDADLRQEIEEWFNYFKPQLMKEILRRVHVWQKKQSGGNVFEYLRAILKELRENEVTTRAELKKRDRLYRETLELAKLCGLSAGELKNNSAQKKILESWLTEKHPQDTALELEVAKYAIFEATRRSRSRYPSLKYIEENFITPFKRNGVKNIQQAEDCIEQSSPPVEEKESTAEGKKEKTLHERFAIWAE